MLFAGRGNGRQSSELFPGLLRPAAAGLDGGICSKVLLVTTVELTGTPERLGSSWEPLVLQPKTTVSHM